MAAGRRWGFRLTCALEPCLYVGKRSLLMMATAAPSLRQTMMGRACRFWPHFALCRREKILFSGEESALMTLTAMISPHFAIRLGDFRRRLRGHYGRHVAADRNTAAVMTAMLD